MKKNILYLESGSGFGGSSVCLYEVLKNLDRAKFNPVVAYYWHGHNIEDIENDLNVETIDLNSFTRVPSLFSTQKRIKSLKPLWYLYIIYKEIRQVLVLLMIIRRRQISIIHINNGFLFDTASALFVARLAGISSVCHLRGNMNTQFTGFGVLAKLPVACVAISKTVEEAHVKAGVLRDKIIRIYDGIDIEKFNSNKISNQVQVREELGVREDSQIVMTVGRLVEEKGYADLIRAAAIVVTEHPNVMFLIVGAGSSLDGDIQSQLQKQVSDLGLQQNVIFTGWRDNVPEILAISDIYIQNSSIPEGLGIAAIEAMAMNKPVVATNIGGLTEVVENGLTGFLVPLFEPERLAKAIATLLSDSALAKEMGVNGGKRAEEIFSIGESCRKLENLYESLLSNET